MRFKDTFSRAKDAFRLGLGMLLKDTLDIPNVVKGELFIEMTDAASGEIIYQNKMHDGGQDA